MGQPSNFSEANPTKLKIDFPRFNGEDPNGWIYRCEQYFEFKLVEESQQFRGPLTWNEFTRAVLHQFGPTDYDNPSEALARLKQVSSVTLYQAEFKKLSQQIDHLPESHLVGCFLTGLRDDIRVELKMKQPRSLSEAIGVAWLIEERNQLQRRNMGAQRATLVSPPQCAAAQTSAGLLGPPPANRINSTDSLPVRRISAQEARERRLKGLYFYCDEKFVPGHRCNKPQLFMIAEPTPHDGEGEEMITEISDIENSLPEISLHAITGATHPQTFWVKGKIQNIEVTTLIDGGSTHNFMDQTLVKRLGLSMDQGNKLPIMVANGDRIECVGKCMGLTLTVQNCPMQSDFYVLPVAACPIILGVQWLETLGPIETDYRQLTMKFKLDDRPYQLQGIHRASISALEVSDLCGVEQVACFLLTTEVDTWCERESPPEELE
ncbi:hypothetical protein FEM48_Zijuj01G0040500 [Ziziphus jujuba var. spinosa]|uniref:Retrotransposon gag domain-containing protein n=1 Tax=Ziziphus jujuba var. spinosa TaxID=714518 RepID=A0A978VZ17_ZIZJJ|nr:hypothetical protein FEM48_Zijuj01G0040500 [Ziziphus jujuba var. spinosa]